MEQRDEKPMDLNATDVDTNLSFYSGTNTTYSVSGVSATIQVAVILRDTGIVIGVLSIILNIVFLVIIRFLNERSSPYYRLMKSLSAADLMASFLFLLTQHYPRGPFARLQRGERFMLKDGLPYVFRSLPWMFFTGYLFTLSALTVQQYIAVCKPWKYSSMVTERRVGKLLLLVWSLSSLQVVIPTIVVIILFTYDDTIAAKIALYNISNVEIQVWMAIFALTAVLNIILDTVIYRKIKQLKLKRRNGNLCNQDSLYSIRMKQEAFITISLLLLTSLFCRLPFPLFSIVGINLQSVLNVKNIGLLHSVISLLLFVNFLADPIIYVLRLKEVRSVIQTIGQVCLMPCCAKRRQAGSEGRGKPARSQQAELTQTMATEMCALRRSSRPDDKSGSADDQV